MTSASMKVSDFIIQYLKRAGVRYIYGCIGGAVTHLVDSICKEPGIEFIHCYHEQAAAFAASASSKFSGDLSVALATSGPGATNFITGIADAYFDSAPVLFLSGQVNTFDFKYERAVRQFGFQETDIVNIVRPITKYSILLDKCEDVEEELGKAVGIALSGRPGPVYVDIPMDIQRGEIEFKFDHAGSYSEPGQQITINEKDMVEISQYISDSRRPLILAGGGCRVSGADKILLEVAEKLKIPVVVSLMGKDSFPHDHPLFSGFIGAYGNRFGNIAMAECDLLLVLGSRLDSRQIGNVVTPFTGKKIIQVDIDANEIGQRLQPLKHLICDAKVFLSQLCSYPESNDDGRVAPWLSFILELKKLFPPVSEMRRGAQESFHYEVMQEISANMGTDDVVCVDVGQNQMLAAQVLEIRGGQRFINSGGMAPMGYSLPASVPIALEYGKRTVVVTGDGGMQMNIQELSSISKHKLPVIIIVLNNKSLGMIKQFQEMYFEGRYCAVDENSGYQSVDFAEIAKAYGIDSRLIDRNTKRWKDVIAEAFKSNGLPLLIQVDLDYQTYIFPKLEFDKAIDRPEPKLSATEEKQLLGMIRTINE